MIDLHTHFLPGVDDGSQSVAASVSVLKVAAAAGVTDVLLSPHYLKGGWDNTRIVVDTHLPALLAGIEAEGLAITLHRGAEVHLGIGTHKDIKDFSLQIDDTRYVLVETDMNGFPANLDDAFYQILKLGYRPIFAHPERYQDIIRNYKRIEDIIHRDVLVQVNAPSLLGKYGPAVRDTAIKMLDAGYVHLIASDCHARHSDYDLPAAVAFVRERYGDYYAELLSRIHPEMILNDEEVPSFFRHPNPRKPKTLIEKMRDFFVSS